MQHNHIRGFKLVKPHGRLHGLAGVVHERLGLEQDHTIRAKASFDRQPVMFGFPSGKTVVLRDAVQRHKADVMPVARVFRAWIAKPYDQFHADPLS